MAKTPSTAPAPASSSPGNWKPTLQKSYAEPPANLPVFETVLAPGFEKEWRDQPIQKPRRAFGADWPEIPPPMNSRRQSASAVTKPDSLSEATKNKKLFSFTAAGADLKSALAMFARANKLNIVPDNDVSGTVTVDVQNLPLEQVMRALLEANDCGWEERDGLIRIRSTTSRVFSVDYLRLTRSGNGQSSAMLTSGGSGGGGGGGGGSIAVSGQGSSAIQLSQTDNVDFWTELKAEVEKLLTEKGKPTLAINKTAGILQVTDRPSAIRRLESYLEGLGRSVKLQIEIEVQILDVNLSDQFQFGINWDKVVKMSAGEVMTFGATPTITSGLGPVAQIAPSLTMNYVNSAEAVSATVQALREQGEVSVVCKPRLRTMNNQTAMIKVGKEKPYFSKQTTTLPGSSSGTTTQLDQYNISTITIGTILAITPQASTNDWISLDISPVMSQLDGEEKVVQNGVVLASAPILNVKQISALVRVRSGNTVILGGLIQEDKAQKKRRIPVASDIPVLGYLFTGTLDYKEKREMVMMITPRIVEAE
jgi:MSHA type pilus biogenesis protein MshL